MTGTTSLTMQVTPRNTFTGADIDGVDLTRPLAAATVAAIREALLTWKVVFFRDQHLDHAQHVAFARQFGTPSATTALKPNRWRQVDGYPEIFPIAYQGVSAYPDTLRGASPGAAERIRQEMLWHQDGTTYVNPPLGTVLLAGTVPRAGGDTGFANAVAAYNGLPESLRHFADGLRALHRLNVRGLSEQVRKDVYAAPRSAIHPVVRVHPETGERALFVNRIQTEDIIGLTSRQSQRVLDLLYDEMEKPEYSVQFRWAAGSIAFWDNRAAMHRGPADLDRLEPRGAGRELFHVALLGDVPVGVDGQPSTSIEGDPAEPYVPPTER
jgi:alpha-ketoglutarate-dependent sulfate ester dioxygenase